MVSKRERALETHQFLPINANLLGPNPVRFHSADPVKGSCSADKNLFRVASRSAHVPPNGLESITATCHPPDRHRDATADAASPVPITATSNFLAMPNALVLPRTRNRCLASANVPRVSYLGALVRLRGMARIRRGLHKRPCWFLHRRRSPALVSFRTAPLLLNWNFRFDLCLAHCMLLLP
jgi:hypothetical protein